jgi:nicotinate-nucleotide pyrophosphorylase
MEVGAEAVRVADTSVDAVPLDNTRPEAVADCGDARLERAITEASGGISEEPIGSSAATGVDVVSMGCARTPRTGWT